MAEAYVAKPVAAQQKLAVAAPRWAVLGILFGLLSVAAIALYGPIGVSTTYPRFIGAIMDAVAPAAAKNNAYVQKLGSLLKPETMLVVGLLVGGFLARLLWRAPVPAIETVHAEERTPVRRYVNAFLGGVLIIFGARLAGGCTSGHIISGITQLALSGVLFAAGVFGFGMLTARLMKGGN